MELQSDDPNLERRLSMWSLTVDELDEETLQPQPVGPRTKHDAPPSDAAVHRMGVVAAVAALRAHVAVARVVEEACRRMADLAEEGDRLSALEAGALEAVQAAMEAHPKEAGVLEGAGAALRARWADGERLVAGGKGLWG